MLVVNYKYEGASCEIKTFDNQKIAIGKLYRAFADYLWISSSEPLYNLEKYDDMLIKLEISHATLNSLTVMGKLKIDKNKPVRTLFLKCADFLQHCIHIWKWN